MTSLLTVIITSPEETVWQGEVESVSSKNASGAFDILPDHANFVTLIKNEPILLHGATGEVHTFTFNEAVIVNKENEVKIYANILHEEAGGMTDDKGTAE